MGSALAYRGIPLQAAYCGAKHAIRGFTDSLRAELIAEGSPIRVSIVELPAVNTPQFDWARAHIRNTPRPMGRPVQPEVVADAVFRASRGSWREYWLGLPTMFLILGDFVLPGALDHYLAKPAIGGQQTKTPVVPSRPDNLDHPVTALHRVRGSFGAEAETQAPLVVGEVARLATVAAGALVFFAAGALYAGAQTRPCRLLLQPSSPSSCLLVSLVVKNTHEGHEGARSSQLAAARHRPDPVGGAAGDRLDGERGIDAADRRKDRAVADP